MVSAVARGRMREPDEEDENRIVYKDRVFATQEYIPWFIGSLRLGDKVDMSRVRNNQVRVLVGHNGQDVIGRVLRARHDRDTECFRSDFEIPKIAATADTREKIAADLMRDISVGAKLNWDAITIDNPDEDWESLDDVRWTAHEWQYVEQSMTPIPADGRAGLDRVDVLDLQREDGEDVVVFGPECVTLTQRTIDNHQPRFVQTISDLKRREATMTTLSAAEALEAARKEQQTKRESESDQQAFIRSIAKLEVDGEEQKVTIIRLEGELSKANTALESVTEAREAETTEMRGLKETLTYVHGKLDEAETARTSEAEKREEEEKRNMEYRNKLDKIQFQPGGPVLQLTNWNVGDRLLSLGNIVKLTWQGGKSPDSPTIDPTKVTLEESFMEVRQSEVKAQTERHPMSSNTVAEIPFSALAERERQELMVRNSNMASGVGVRPLDITVLGDAGLVLARYAPILARMDVMMGVVGDQKLSYLSAQDTPTPNAEGANIVAGTWTVGGDSKQPHTIPAAFQMTTSLRAIDDGTFERIVRSAIFMVLNNGVVKQILIGNGTAPNLTGIWSKTGVQNVNYGAAATNFNRQDILDVLNSVRLSDTDGSMPVMVASKGLWELMEKTPRGTDGTSSEGYTEIQKFLLDDIMHSNVMVMGMSEGSECHYYSDLTPAGVTNGGLVFKGDRAVVWFWGDSLALEYVPQTSANYFYKMCAEVNADFELPGKNFARLKQT